MLERLRLGAWPLAVLSVVFAGYFRQFGSFALPAVVLLLALAARMWRSPSGSSLVAGFLGSAAAGAWALWHLSQPWSPAADATASPLVSHDTLRLLPAVFAIGAMLQLGRLLYLWHRFPELRPRGSA